MPPGMSSPCWWAQRGGVLPCCGDGGLWGHPAAGSIPADGFVCCVPPPPPLLPTPRGGEDTRVRAMCMCPPPLPPLPRRAWVAHPEPAPPSPFPSPDCLSEYKKNKLCCWPPASQKHLMSRSAQAALWGCVNLEEFPAWELLLGELQPPSCSKSCPPRGAECSLLSPRPTLPPCSSSCTPLGMFSLLLAFLCKRFGAWGGCLAGYLQRSLCPRMAGSVEGWGLRPPSPEMEM